MNVAQVCGVERPALLGRRGAGLKSPLAESAVVSARRIYADAMLGVKCSSDASRASIAEAQWKMR